MDQRNPQRLLQLATDLDVVTNFAFLPHKRVLADGQITPLLTTCNCYACVFFAALGCNVPPKKANDLYLWFQSAEAKMQGWQAIDKSLATARANLGYPVAVVAYNGAGPGHIGVGMPNPADLANLYVSAAGATNYVRVLFEKTFGHLVPGTKFFTRP